MESIFPNEIWEQILDHLPLEELLPASCVCRQWRHLVRRICRQRCKCLPSRLLAELVHEHYTTRCRPQGMDSEIPDGREEPDWLDVSRMLIQTQVTSRAEACSVVSQINQVILLTAAEKFVVAVTRSGEDQSCTLSLVSGEGRVTCQYLVHGKVNKVCVLEEGGEPSVLAVSVNKELLGLLVHPDLRSLTALTITPNLAVDSRICSDGQTLVVSQLEENYHLSVYRATLLPGRLQLNLQSRIRTTSPSICWDLWNGFVTTLVPSGHIRAYTLCGALVAESPLYKDLRYPNPTLLARGLVLASTITSRTLLSYWHMDRDRDYWLVGESVLTSWLQRGPHAVGNTSPRRELRKDSGSSVSNGSPSFFEGGNSCVVTLAKVRLGAAVLLEVTIVQYQRGLVFCGTSQGYLLVYKIMEDTWKSEAGLKWEVLEACMPSLCLSLTRRPLARIAVCFIDAVIMVTVGDRDGNCHMVSLPTSAPQTSVC
ncbi:uncharacterized protein LOC123505146 [Portunus trituberculatus]|uniref:uncharacterized protein LOC123505146 n=1 Tax=Portunus trituberculatus TaxID=210409 RepID=UPI001E1CFDAF|nr:uncharacterized protein LOC123505146 [Portunus trituberculatus]